MPEVSAYSSDESDDALSTRCAGRESPVGFPPAGAVTRTVVASAGSCTAASAADDPAEGERSQVAAPLDQCAARPRSDCEHRRPLGPGTLTIVLHTHLPYVEGFDTWPFGEEWLWEAAATCYIPLLELLRRHRDGEAVSLSVTPVLADQLLAPGIAPRFDHFLGTTREHVYGTEIHELRHRGMQGAAQALAFLRERYRAAHRPSKSTIGDLARGLARHASWTSSATHAILPLIATRKGLEMQLRVGIDSHRRRSGEWSGGLWLPECAYSADLDATLAAVGVRTTCVDLTSHLGHGSPDHLQPYKTPAGTTVIPLDRLLMDLVWSDGAMPAGDAYLDSHRLTRYQLRAWSNDGLPWCPRRARHQTRDDARVFVRAVRERVATGGHATVAFDTEFLGHAWAEGLWWLEAVLDEAGAQGLRVVRADSIRGSRSHLPTKVLDRAAAAPSSWGREHDLSTWSGPKVTAIAEETATLERAVVDAGVRATPRAWRELLAAQASDWAFLKTFATAGDYPDRRFAGHAAALRRELHSPGTLGAELRGLAPCLENVLRASGT